MHKSARRAARLTAISAGALVLVSLAGGCSTIRDHRGYLVDAALLDSLQPGIDNRLSVEKSLGRPTFVSQFGPQDWYYVSMNTRTLAFKRPNTYEQTVVRVQFDPAGNVTRIDRAGMDKVVRLDPDNHVTPTLGKDRSFLEDLFGNIGAVGAPGAPTGAAGGSGPNGS